MTPSTHDTVWFALTVGGALGALLMWLAEGDPWWLGAALLALCIPTDDDINLREP